MAPKVTEKQHTQQHDQKPLQNNSIAIKHSNTFYISAFTLCHNKRLKIKRSKYAEFLRNVHLNKRETTQQISKKTELRRQKLNSLQADVVIDLLSDDEEQINVKNTENPSVIVYPERMCLERAAILGLMPVERLVKPPPKKQISTNHNHRLENDIKPGQKLKSQQNINKQPFLLVPTPKHLQQQQQPRKRKSKPQKRRSAPVPPKTPFLLNAESIVLSDDSNDVPMPMPPPPLPHTYTPLLQPPELSVTCPTSSQIPCLTQQNTIQVDEEVTISLVPRSLNTTTCASRSSLNSATAEQDAFPMLPDETTVHTVISNRIYELSLAKLREGLASCVPEFADRQQKISPQRRKGMIQQPPLVSPPQAPISLKLSSDLSISLISDDEEDIRQNNCRIEPILSPAFLQKLPVNVSIAPVPMVPSNSSHANEPRKLKLG